MAGGTTILIIHDLGLAAVADDVMSVTGVGRRVPTGAR
jgi:hypothetical protein